jgi:hypothetical protein
MGWKRCGRFKEDWHSNKHGRSLHKTTAQHSLLQAQWLQHGSCATNIISKILGVSSCILCTTERNNNYTQRIHCSCRQNYGTLGYYCFTFTWHYVFIVRFDFSHPYSG